jgi:hypothetical protein
MNYRMLMNCRYFKNISEVQQEFGRTIVQPFGNVFHLLNVVRNDFKEEESLPKDDVLTGAHSSWYPSTHGVIHSSSTGKPCLGGDRILSQCLTTKLCSREIAVSKLRVHGSNSMN